MSKMSSNDGSHDRVRAVWPIVFDPPPRADVPLCLVDRLYLNMTTAPTRSTSRPIETTTRVLLVSIKQASEMLSISRSVIYQLMDAGQLTPIRIGRSVRLPVEQLERFVADRLATVETRCQNQDTVGGASSATDPEHRLAIG